MASGWEKLDDRIRETGADRYFLPGHGALCGRMADVRYSVGDDAARRFVDDELAMRERMDGQAGRLDDVADRLRDCVRERERVGERDRPFVEHWDYRHWREGAEVRGRGREGDPPSRRTGGVTADPGRAGAERAAAPAAFRRGSVRRHRRPLPTTRRGRDHVFSVR